MRGVVIVGHGSKGEFFREVLETHRERIEKLKLFSEVKVGFIAEGEPKLEEVIPAMKSEKIFIVPLFISQGYHVSENLPEIIGSIKCEKELILCEAVGDDIFVTLAIINKIFRLVEF
jgi:sirohydrochlorin ferrochelatase